ncbi:MAG: phosphatase PAP2 family protein [Lachnospiraceae bacterium]
MEFLHMLQSIRNPVLTVFFRLCTLLGEEIFVIALLCFLFWCINKALAYRIAFTYFASGMLVQILKLHFRIPRPWVRDTSIIPDEAARKTATGYSFPSGHTQGATSIFTTFSYTVKRSGFRIICAILILLVALSRMYLCVHTPADVLTAFVLSFLLSLFVNYLLDHFKATTRNKAVLSTAMILIAVATMLYSYILLQKGIIVEELTADCFKAAGSGIGFAIAWYIEITWIQFQEKHHSNLYQSVKYIIGLLVALVLKSAIKVLLGTTLWAHAVRYFLIVLWIIAIYPTIFTKLEKRSKSC